jgi:two-component system OmpR family sensor kinase
MGARRDELADLAHDFDSMADRLQTLVATRDRLLHDVSHELRSPLARLGVAVALARQNRELTDQALARIEAESARLNLIVGELLSLARAESEAPAEEIYFDVGEMLQVVCADARFEAQPRDVGVQLELSPAFTDAAQAPLIAGDPELLHRALENVIRNALRFTPAGKRVQVEARVAGASVEINVHDEGPGVPADLLAQMFEPFVKGAGDARSVGLGLAIARRAIAAHNGRVEAVNRDAGGLVMRVSLPVAGGLSDATLVAAS